MLGSAWPGVLGGAFVALCLVASSSCKTDAFFQCSQDSECVSAGPDGRCEPTNFCSFPDASCDSGFRYPEDGGHDGAGQCVPPSVADTGTGGNDDPPDGPDDDADDRSDQSDQSTLDDPTSEDGFNSCDALGPIAECDPAVDTEPVPCADLGRGFDSGMATCTPTCFWDTFACAECGDGLVDGDEVCDGVVAGRNCVSLGRGYTGGTVTCGADCTAIDATNCFSCGNDELELGEACDGELLGGTDCAALGYASGPVTCSKDCVVFDTTACQGVSCGVEPPAPRSACPSECTSCENGTCVIDCSVRDDCEGRAIVCPPDRPCSVLCDGIDTCFGSTLTCPRYFGCDLFCDGIDSCEELEMSCGAVGSCGVDCQGPACDLLNVQCGGDACVATCVSDNLVTLDCGTSCSCSNDCSGS